MRRRTVIVPLLLLAGALMAWRRHRTRVTSPPLDAPVESAPIAQLLPPPRFVSVGWTLVAAPEDRNELTVRYACAERLELDRVDAQETPTQVFVTVLMRWQPAAGGRFTERQECEARVGLSAPLGTRALVHAPVDPDTPGSEPESPPLYP